MCSYFFCPVEKLAVMNRKLLEKKTSVCNENANYSGFILPNKFRLKFGSFSKSWINDAKCEKKTKLEVARKLISQGNKNLGSWVEANDFFHGSHLPQRSWRSRTWLTGIHYGSLRQFNFSCLILPQSNKNMTGALGGALCVIDLDRFNWNHRHLDEVGMCEQFYDYSRVHKLRSNQKQLP